MSAVDPVEEEIAGRADDVVGRGRTFRRWLRINQEREEYQELARLVLGGGDAFAGRRFLGDKFEVYREELERIDRLDLVEILLFAFNEWHADFTADISSRVSLGLSDAIASVTRVGGVTAETPVPVSQCGFIDPMTSRRCEDAAIPGAIRCRRHGGDWLDPRVRQGLLMAAYMKLVEASEIAVDALVWVAVHGKREDARVMAAREILDRSGLRVGAEIEPIDVAPANLNQASQILERLSSMAHSMEARDKLDLASPVDGEIVDAEIVEVVEEEAETEAE